MNNNICTGLRMVPLTPDYPHLDYLFDIRDEAFPPNEIIASRDVSMYNEENGYVFLAFEDDNVPIGFMLLQHCDDNLYYGILLAIGKEFRNRHYGSRALKLVLNEYLKEKTMFGCVEALLPEAENYQQRADRVSFYQRNGMYLLDGVIDAGPMGKYQFVCTDPNATYQQLKPQIPLTMLSLIR